MKLKYDFFKKSPFLRVAAAVCLLAVIFFCIFAAREIFGAGGNDKVVYMEIRSGETLSEIADELCENKIIKYKRLFGIYAKNKYVSFQYGGHVFTTAMSYKEVCEQLATPGTSENVRLVVPEGYELSMIADACEDIGLLGAKEFMRSADNDDFDYDFITDKSGVRHRLEGFLFPATYEFSYGMSAHDVIDAMLKKFDEVYTKEYSNRAKSLGMSDYDIVTLASVIEREAADASEHKRVSGVFKNRLRDGMNLQSCATVQYILKERKPVLSVEDTKIDSPYNTYINSGLPVGPIASPGKSAIEAALYPEEHDYYYFVAKSDGNGHVFSKTFEEHQKAVSQNQ